MKLLVDACNSNKIPLGGMGSSGKAWMNGLLQASDISSLVLRGLSWSWMLPSIKSNPWWSLENLVNIVDLLNFPIYP
jgi:hypothetical protein